MQEVEEKVVEACRINDHEKIKQGLKDVIKNQFPGIGPLECAQVTEMLGADPSRLSPELIQMLVDQLGQIGHPSSNGHSIESIQCSRLGNFVDRIRG